MSFWEKALKKTAACGKAFLGLVFFVCADLLVTFAFYFLNINGKTYKGTRNFVTCIAVFFAMFIFIKVSSGRGEPLVRMGKLTPDQIAALVVIGLGMIGMVVTYIGIADKISEYLDSLKESIEEYRESMDRYSDTPAEIIPAWDAILYAFTLSFLTPITEEMVFRGVVFGELRKAFGPWTSVILSALVFGVMHGITVHIGYAVACGLIIAASYLITDSLYAPVILHMIFNFFGSGVANFMSVEAFGIQAETTRSAMIIINTASIILMPFAVLAFVYLIAAKRKRAKAALELATEGGSQVELAVEEKTVLSEDDGIEAKE